jgi:hypothetical protein
MWRLPDRHPPHIDRRAVKLYSTVFSLTIKSKVFSILLKGLSHEMNLAFSPGVLATFWSVGFGTFLKVSTLASH